MKIHIRLFLCSLPFGCQLPLPAPGPPGPFSLLTPLTSPCSSTLVTNLHSSYSIRQTHAVNRCSRIFESSIPASIHGNLSTVCYCPGLLGFLINSNCSEAREASRQALWGLVLKHEGVKSNRCLLGLPPEFTGSWFLKWDEDCGGRRWICGSGWRGALGDPLGVLCAGVMRYTAFVA